MITEETIQKAQDYLTVRCDNQQRRIIDIELLLYKFPVLFVVAFLQELLNYKKRVLGGLLARDKTDSSIDKVISVSFRIYMAINIICNIMDYKIMEGGKLYG